jgi:inosine/xanthosine triphosphatase
LNQSEEKEMKYVVIGSTNPVKIKAVKLVFMLAFPNESMFGFEAVKADSGVKDQPISDKETMTGALNRVTHAQELMPGADFYVGLEGGVEDINGELHEFAWIVVLARDGKVGKGKSCTFIAPPIFRKLVLDGMEVGDISDQVFGKANSKQDMGAIGLLTNNVVDRTDMYRHAVASALMPFLHPDLYNHTS